MSEQHSLTIPPPFPDPKRWRLVNEEQEQSGIIKWTVLKNKETLSMTESIKQHINDYNNNKIIANNNVINNSNAIIDINDNDDDEYEEILEMNDVWVSKLASTVQRLKNRHKKKSNKSSRKMKMKNI